MDPIPSNAKIFSSWKEIAAHFGKGVRTVQRWELEYGLPISRPNTQHKGVVISSSDKLDQWLAVRWSQRPDGEESVPASVVIAVAANIRESRQLREANRELRRDMLRAVDALRVECDALVRTASRKPKQRDESASSTVPS